MDKLRIDSIMDKIREEIKKQEEKWGQQDHPVVDQVIASRVGKQTKRMAEEYEIPTPTRAKQLCSMHADRGDITWMHILQEEVSEVIENYKDKEEVVKELIQVVAVSISTIDSILRNGLNGKIKTVENQSPSKKD